MGMCHGRSAGSDPFLIVCCYFSIFTATTNLLCITVNIDSAVQSFRDGVDCYVVLLWLFVGIIKTDWRLITKF